MYTLYQHQLDALNKMKNGCILNGNVGSGKSLTAIAYYYLINGGKRSTLLGKEYEYMSNPMDLYIITTAKKRDTFEWDKELAPFLLSTDPTLTPYKNKVAIDSWNNIKKYENVYNSFFIFDEQRVVGYGAWSRTFIKIAKKNKWILLSATPGDKWEDYIPVFIANGFYKNKTEFKRRHITETWINGMFPKVLGYRDTQTLYHYRNLILVNMESPKIAEQHHENIFVEYDKMVYKNLGKTKWNPYEHRPIRSPSELCYLWRRIVNSDESRLVAVMEIYESHQKVIIFYNFDYELELLKSIHYGPNVTISEWNGHKHEPVPKTNRWVYLVQYAAGCEGWNCITTDTIIFYSQNYSYKTTKQASGRIDRLNTPYKDLYYYHLKSHSGIDMAISRALSNKKKFNEKTYYESIF